MEGPYDREKDDISELWMQIRGWRVEMGMGAEPRGNAIQQSVHVPIKKLRLCEQNPKVKTDKCMDVCKLADAICDNAEQICRIASELHDDPWANDKCNSAKASCKEATGQCCECAAKEPNPAAGRDNVCAD
jgi:hypothetical protein